MKVSGPQGRGNFPGWTCSQNMQLQIAAKPLVLWCHLVNTHKELGRLATAIPLFAKLLWFVLCSKIGRFGSVDHSILTVVEIILYPLATYNMLACFHHCRPDRQNRIQPFHGILLKVTIQNFKESACKSSVFSVIILITSDMWNC